MSYLWFQVSHKLLSAVDFGTLTQVKVSTVNFTITYQPPGRLGEPTVTKGDLKKGFINLPHQKSHSRCEQRGILVTFEWQSISPYRQQSIAANSGVVTAAVRCLQSFTK